MKVTVVYFGICAFVPSSSSSSGIRLTAVLPDARNPVGQWGLTKHVPKLWYLKEDTEGWKWQQRVLDREEITIGGLSLSQQSLKLQVVPTSTARKPNTARLEQIHVRWIAHIKEVLRSAGKVASNVVTPSGGIVPVSDQVVARVRMPAGSFRSTEVSNIDGDVFVWTFLPTPSQHAVYQQALTFQSRWTFEVEEDESAKVFVTPFTQAPPGSSDERDHESIIVRPESNKGVLLIVTNLSEAIAGEWQPPGSGELALTSSRREHGQQLRPDVDFRWYYKLSAGVANPNSAPIPHPNVEDTVQAMPLGLFSKTSADGLIGGGPVRCPQSFFEPDTNA